MFLKNKYGKWAWNRVMSLGSALILAAAFIIDALSEGTLNKWAYMTFPAGMLICYSPVMANKLIISVTVLVEAIAKVKLSGSTVGTVTETTPEGTTTTETKVVKEDAQIAQVEAM